MKSPIQSIPINAWMEITSATEVCIGPLKIVYARVLLFDDDGMVINRLSGGLHLTLATENMPKVASNVFISIDKFLSVNPFAKVTELKIPSHQPFRMNRIHLTQSRKQPVDLIPETKLQRMQTELVELNESIFLVNQQIDERKIAIRMVRPNIGSILKKSIGQLIGPDGLSEENYIILKKHDPSLGDISTIQKQDLINLLIGLKGLKAKAIDT